MAARRRQAARLSTRSGVVAVGLSLGIMVAGCSWSRLDDVSSTESSSAGDPTGEMRAVPAVSSTPVDAPVSGGEAAVVPEAPSAPLTTEVVGDPRPDPDSDTTLPPLPDVPVVAACTRLGELGAAEQFAGASTAVTAVTTVALGDQGCRFTSGSAVAEIHYVAEDAIESDWFVRDSIEPVGDVTSDAVGIAAFAAPGSDAAAGYTIALVSRREGAVIAVRGTPDDRAGAVLLANLVEAST